MFEQVGNEHYGMPIEAIMPLLVGNYYEVYQMFCRGFGADRMEELYGVIETRNWSSELAKAAHVLLAKEIVEESELHWCGKMTVNRNRVVFRVQSYAGVYIICTEEPREFGYFLSLEDARAFLKFHWAPVVGAQECEDDWEPEERLEEQASAHVYIDRVQRHSRVIG